MAQVDYLELTVPDREAAKSFYGAAFGWSFTDYGPGYSGFDDGAGRGETGGFNVSAQPAAPLMVLLSDDLDAARARVVAAGGVITEEHTFPGGRRFHFRDPFGNSLAVWTKG